MTELAGIMWRAAGVSYLRYSNEMAAILRQCLREPYREKALQKNTVHLLEKTWVNGTVASKTVLDDLSKGFDTSGAAAGEGKEPERVAHLVWPNWPDSDAPMVAVSPS